MSGPWFHLLYSIDGGAAFGPLSDLTQGLGEVLSLPYVCVEAELCACLTSDAGEVQGKPLQCARESETVQGELERYEGPVCVAECLTKCDTLDPGSLVEYIAA